MKSQKLDDNSLKFKFNGVNKYIQTKQANTAEISLNDSQIEEYQQKVLQNKVAPVLHQKLINQSLTQTINSKLPSLIIIFQSKDQKNRQATLEFLKLWKLHKNKMNFILIDLDGQLNYYASLLLKEYWKDESLKIIALDSSGTIRIQMKNSHDLINDLSRLNHDLKILEAKDPHGFNN